MPPSSLQIPAEGSSRCLHCLRVVMQDGLCLIGWRNLGGVIVCDDCEMSRAMEEWDGGGTRIEVLRGKF